MPYTAATLTEALHAQMLTAQLASVLNWSIEGDSYVALITSVQQILGHPLEALPASQDRAVFAVGRVVLWQQVLTALTLFYSFSSQGSSFQRKEALDNIRYVLDMARAEAQALGIDDPALSSMIPAVTQSVAWGGTYHVADEWC